MLEDIERWLEDWWGAPGFSLVRLKGDASLRAFYRIRRHGESYVVMDSGRTDLGAFLNVHALLLDNGFPVPEIYETNQERKWVIMEDLGDTRLLDLEEEDRKRLVEDEALGLLAGMQEVLDRSALAGSIAGQRSFTANFFMAELEQTVQHLFYRLLRVPEERLRPLQDMMRKLCDEVVEDVEMRFLHRDFHSANLMVTSRGLVIVDWQDSRLGPPEYDLVSILRDSYFDYGSDWLDRALAFPGMEAGRSERRLAATGCQRNLKAAGTFAYQYRAFGRKHYLSHIPRTMRYLFQYCDIHPEIAPLVDDVHDILLTFTGEIDLRGFEDSDSPMVLTAGSRPEEPGSKGNTTGENTN